MNPIPALRIRQIKETSLYVADLERSLHFYHQLLGLPVISREEGRHVFLRAGQSVLLLFNAARTSQDTCLPPHGGYGHLHLAFEVALDEYQRWKDILPGVGIPVIHEHHWQGAIRSFYFHDPDGHVLEIVPTGMWDR
jgi:catechol 2,3-dioxygenase-like lactoylglutathione lyase family enzyme